MSNNPAPFRFSSWSPDPVGAALGTGFSRFRTPTGLHGLAAVAPGRLYILAVVSDAPGKGHFRDFITTAKAHFDEIGVWSIWSPELAAALVRYGFEGAKHWKYEEGLVWRPPGNFSMSNEANNKEYLGDAVYCQTNDRGQLVLTVEDGIEQTAVIYIEPEVWGRLVDYVERLRGEGRAS